MKLSLVYSFLSAKAPFCYVYTWLIFNESRSAYVYPTIMKFRIIEILYANHYHGQRHCNAYWRNTTSCTTGHSEHVPVKSITGDIQKFEDVLAACDGIDAVIHTAALISIKMFPDIKRMEGVNVQGTGVIMYQ